MDEPKLKVIRCILSKFTETILNSKFHFSFPRFGYSLEIEKSQARFSKICNIYVHPSDVIELHFERDFWLYLSSNLKCINELLSALDSDDEVSSSTARLLYKVGLIELCCNNRNTGMKFVGQLILKTIDEVYELILNFPSLNTTLQRSKIYLNHCIHVLLPKSYNYGSCRGDHKYLSTLKEAENVSVFIEYLNEPSKKFLNEIGSYVESFEFASFYQSLINSKKQRFCNLCVSIDKIPMNVDIGRRSIDKEICSVLNFTNLISLDLSDISINHFPCVILKMNKLCSLNLNCTQITEIPFEIDRLTSLKELRLKAMNLIDFPKIEMLGFLEVFEYEPKNKVLHDATFEYEETDLIPNSIFSHYISRYLSRPFRFYNENMTELTICSANLNRFPEDIFKMINLRKLNLSRNRIHVFPYRLFTLRNLKDLDISKNKAKFCGNLYELCGMICPIEILNIGGNFIRNIGEILLRLRKLTELNLSNCKIQDLHELVPLLPCSIKFLDVSYNMIDTLPNDLFLTLSSLQNLNAGFNRIDKFPKFLSRCKNLKNLDLRSNEISSIPEDMLLCNELVFLNLEKNNLRCLPTRFRLPKLRNLFLSRNKLQNFPDLGAFCSLEILDVSRNEIQAIKFNHMNLLHFNASFNKLTEFSFKNISYCPEFILHNNLFSFPPLAIINMGIKAIKSFLCDVGTTKVYCTPQIKLLIIGKSGSGKTTLCRQLTNKYNNSAADETDLTEFPSFSCGFPKTNQYYLIKVFDLPGQDIYDSIHRIFFTPHSLQILNIDLFSYSLEKFHNYVGKWIESLMCYLPFCAVIVILSHEDEILDGKSRISKFENFKFDLENYLSTKQSSRRVDSITIPHILGYVLLNCKERDHIGFATLRDMIFDFCNGEKFIKTMRYLPLSWKYLKRKMEEIKHVLYINREDMERSSKYLEIEDWDIVLEFFSRTGTILYFDSSSLCNYIFHRPYALADAFKRIFERDKSLSHCLMDQMILDRLKEDGLMLHQLSIIKDNLKKAVLTGSFLKHLVSLNPWLNHSEKFDVEVLINILLKFQLCFEIKSSAPDACFHSILNEERNFCFPCFLELKPNKRLVCRFFPKFPKLPEDSDMALMITVNTKCSDFITRHIVQWQNQMSYIVKIWRVGFIAVFKEIKLKIESSDFESGIIINISARGRKTSEMLQILLFLKNLFIETMKEYQYVKYFIGIKCPKCLKNKNQHPHVFPFVDRKTANYKTFCPRCDMFVSTNLITLSTAEVLSSRTFFDELTAELKKDYGMQQNWELIATHLKLKHKIEDIRCKAVTLGYPGPSYCIYLLMKELHCNFGEDQCFEKLKDSFIKFEMKESFELIEKLMDGYT